jgi:hypothetical protein
MVEIRSDFDDLLAPGDREDADRGPVTDHRVPQDGARVRALQEVAIGLRLGAAAADEHLLGA